MRALALSLTLLVTTCGGDAEEYYVAPDGVGTNPGTYERPFATLATARDAARALRSRGDQPVAGVTIWLRGGTYVLTESFTLGAQDSGTKEAFITYRSQPGENATLVGGIRLSWSAFKPPGAPAKCTELFEQSSVSLSTRCGMMPSVNCPRETNSMLSLAVR